MTSRTPPSDDENEQSDTVVYQTGFNPTTDSVSEAVIRSVMTLNDADPTELAILSEFVDSSRPSTMKALDALFGPRAANKPHNTNGQVSFTYDAYRVRIDSSGQITFHQSESEPASVSERSPAETDE